MYSYENAVNTKRANVDQMDEIEAEVVKMMNSTVDVACELLNRIGGRSEQADDVINDFKELLSGQVGIENDVRRFRTALIEAVQGVENVAEDLDSLVKETYDRTPNPTNVEDHTLYKELLRVASEINETAAAASQSGVVPRTQPSIDGSQDLIVTQEDNAIPVDPLTKRRVEDPVRNAICKHVYERSTIVVHIARRRGGCRCPVVGCANDRPLTHDLLEEHDELRRQIRRDRATQNTLHL